MLESAWLFIGAVAVGATTIAISTKSKGAALWPNDDAVAIASGTVAFVAWAYWSYASLYIEVVGDSVTHTFSMPFATTFGVMMAIIPAYIALTGPVDIVRRSRNPSADEI